MYHETYTCNTAQSKVPLTSTHKPIPDQLLLLAWQHTQAVDDSLQRQQTHNHQVLRQQNKKKNKHGVLNLICFTIQV